jgi:hypothetical protein
MAYIETSVLPVIARPSMWWTAREKVLIAHDRPQTALGGSASPLVMPYVRPGGDRQLDSTQQRSPWKRKAFIPVDRRHQAVGQAGGSTEGRVITTGRMLPRSILNYSSSSSTLAWLGNRPEPRCHRHEFGHRQAKKMGPSLLYDDSSGTRAGARQKALALFRAGLQVRGFFHQPAPAARGSSSPQHASDVEKIEACAATVPTETRSAPGGQPTPRWSRAGLHTPVRSLRLPGT